jgi:biotin transport system substrate-specific component
MISGNSSTTLLDALAPGDDVAYSGAIRAAWAVFFTALTAAAAQVSVPLPFTQVPFTFQPMVVLLSGLVLGPRLAFSAQVLYLVAGATGLPVFAASAVLPPGALRLLGPTGGYLMIYPFAAFVTGYLAQRGFARQYLGSVVAMGAGLLMVYLAGALWLGYFAQLGGRPVALGFTTALMTSVIPFVGADIAKLLLAAGIVPGLWKAVGNTGANTGANTGDR